MFTLSESQACKLSYLRGLDVKKKKNSRQMQISQQVNLRSSSCSRGLWERNAIRHVNDLPSKDKVRESSMMSLKYQSYYGGDISPDIWLECSVSILDSNLCSVNTWLAFLELTSCITSSSS